MAMAADILIIGGGSTGAAIAYHLAKSRAGQVTLLERATLASGTTGRSSGIVRQHYSIPTLALMAKRSLHVFRHFEELIGGQAGFRQTGLLIAAREGDLAALRAAVAMQQGLGIETRIIDRQELRELEPRLDAEDLAGACHEPEAGYADPVATTVAFAHRARALGAQIRQRTTVAALLAEGERIRGVRLDDDTEIEARVVIVAANVWGVDLLRQCGVDLPIRTTRHACVLLRQPTGFGPQHAVLFDLSNGLYLKPEGTDLTLAGSLDEAEAREADPDHYEERPTHEEQERLAARTARRFPGMAEATLQSGYAGVYDVSADWQPVIDAVQGIEGLYCALGFSGHGYKLSPAVGELVADLVLGRPSPGVDRAMFRLDRFASGAPAQARYAYGIIG